MFIAKKLRQENVCEYLLYMWQIEDLIRALGLDMDRINDQIIKTYPVSEAEKKELYEIYLSFIRGQITDTLDRVEFVDPETGERTAPKQALENLAKEADQDIKEHKDIH